MPRMFALVTFVCVHMVLCFLPVPAKVQRSIQPQRGPVCFDCAIMDHPNSCPHLTICNIGQVCMLREIRDFSTGTLKYHTACESPLVCAGYGNHLDTIDRRQTHGCLTCCYTDYCNDQCNGQSGTQVPATLPTLPANTGIGIYCYNCPTMDVPNSCLTFTLCSQDEVCMIRDMYTASSNKIEYAASCESKQVCDALNGIAPSGRCHGCCSTDFCNDMCESMTVQTNPTPLVTSTTRTSTRYPTPAPITTVRTSSRTSTVASPSSTDSVTTNERGRVCYSCNSVDDISHCLNIAQCQNGQICMLSEQAPDENGKITYMASCENKQVCYALSELHDTTSKQVCHVCCDTDLCNRNCSTQLLAEPTKAPTSHTQSTQQTPTFVPVSNTVSNVNSPSTPETTTNKTDSLRCYECANMVAVDDCSRIVTCGQDKVCMIRDVPYPISGGREFATSCESQKVCEVLDSLPGKRTTLCHRCCNTPLCNNFCN